MAKRNQSDSKGKRYWRECWRLSDVSRGRLTPRCQSYDSSNVVHFDEWRLYCTSVCCTLSIVPVSPSQAACRGQTRTRAFSPGAKPSTPMTCHSSGSAGVGDAAEPSPPPPRPPQVHQVCTGCVCQSVRRRVRGAGVCRSNGV